MTYPPPPPDQSGQGGFQYDPYGNQQQPGSQPPQPGGYSPQMQPPPQQPGYGQLPPQMPPQMPPQAPGYPPQYGGPMQPQLPKGQAIAGMVLGIVAAGLWCVPFVNLVCGILGAVLGGLALKKVNAGVGGGKGMAITGMVLGIIVCAWFALWVILWLSGVASLGMAGAGAGSGL